MKKSTFWSCRLYREFIATKALCIAMLIIACFLRFLAYLNTRFSFLTGLDSGKMNLFAFIALIILIAGIINLGVVNFQMNESTERRRKKLIIKTITAFNWVEGSGICWEFDNSVDKFMQVKVKNLYPICIEGQKRFEPNEYKTSFHCEHCGCEISSVDVDQMKRQIEKSLQERIDFLNKPITNYSNDGNHLNNYYHYGAAVEPSKHTTIIAGNQTVNIIIINHRE